jgi:uncharacterized protein YlxP (DUF503 family)
MSVVIGACTIELYLPGSSSLKSKRGLLKPLLSRLRREFNLAAAEVGANDTWQSAVIGVATVANEPAHVQRVLERVPRWIEMHHPEVQVVDWATELL